MRKHTEQKNEHLFIRGKNKDTLQVFSVPQTPQVPTIQELEHPCVKNRRRQHAAHFLEELQAFPNRIQHLTADLRKEQHCASNNTRTNLTALSSMLLRLKMQA